LSWWFGRSCADLNFPKVESIQEAKYLDLALRSTCAKDLKHCLAYLRLRTCHADKAADD
jgi:hypothetical protein